MLAIINVLRLKSAPALLGTLSLLLSGKLLAGADVLQFSVDTASSELCQRVESALAAHRFGTLMRRK